MRLFLRRFSAVALGLSMVVQPGGCASTEPPATDLGVGDVVAVPDVLPADTPKPDMEAADVVSVGEVTPDVGVTPDEETPPTPDTDQPDVAPAPDLLPEQDATLEQDAAPEQDVTEEDVLGPSNPPQFGAPVPVMDNFYPSLGDISLAVDAEGRVSALFAHTVQLAGGGTIDQLALTVSDPETTQFQPPVAVSALSGAAQSDLAIADNDYLIVWTDKNETSNDVEIRFRRAAWPDLDGDNLVLSSGMSGALLRPYLVRATPSTTYAIWEENQNLKVARTSDGGVSFDAAVTIPGTGAAPLSDAAYISPGRLVIAYQGNNGPGMAPLSILAVYSDDGGQTFSEPAVVAAGDASSTLHYPSLAYLVPNDLHVAWHQSGPAGWMTSTSDGLAWDAAQALPIASTNLLLRAGKANTLYVAGLDNKAIAGGALAFLVTPDVGETFWDPGFAPSTPGYIVMPTYDIVADRKKGLLHAAWWELESGPKPSCNTTEDCEAGLTCTNTQCVPAGCTFNCSRLRLATISTP